MKSYIIRTIENDRQLVRVPESSDYTLTIGTPANGLALSAANVLSMALATDLVPGVLSITTQNIAGAKTFTDNLAVTKGTGATTLTVTSTDSSQSAGINAFNNLGAMTYQAIGSTEASTGLANYGRLRTSLALAGMAFEVGAAGTGVMIFRMTNGGAAAFEAMRINATGNLVLSLPLTFQDATTQATAGVLPTRQVISGAGLTGGGTLAADRTLNVVANADASMVVNADDIQVGRLQMLANTAVNVAAGASGFIAVDATGGNRVITLPTAVGIAGRTYAVKKVDVSANTVSVTPNGAETIDGVAAATVLAVQWARVLLVSDGTNWLVFG